MAAVTSAVIASRFGLAGTLVGAALASVVSTTGAALYSQGIRRTGSRVRNLVEEPPALARRLPRLENLTRRTTGETEERPPAEREEQTKETTTTGTPPPGAWRQTGGPATPRTRRLPAWAVPVLATVVVFLIALAAVTGIEGLIGRPLSSVTGGSGSTSGTTLGGWAGGQSTPAPAPSSGTEQPASPSTAPTEEPGTTQPSSQPSAQQQQPGEGSTPGVGPSAAPPSQGPSSPEPQPSAGAPSSP